MRRRMELFNSNSRPIWFVCGGIVFQCIVAIVVHIVMKWRYERNPTQEWDEETKALFHA